MVFIIPSFILILILLPIVLASLTSLIKEQLDLLILQEQKAQQDLTTKSSFPYLATDYLASLDTKTGKKGAISFLSSLNIPEKLKAILTTNHLLSLAHAESQNLENENDESALITKVKTTLGVLDSVIDEFWLEVLEDEEKSDERQDQKAEDGKQVEEDYIDDIYGRPCTSQVDSFIKEQTQLALDDTSVSKALNVSIFRPLLMAKCHSLRHNRFPLDPLTLVSLFDDPGKIVAENPRFHPMSTFLTFVASELRPALLIMHKAVYNNTMANITATADTFITPANAVINYFFNGDKSRAMQWIAWTRLNKDFTIDDLVHRRVSNVFHTRYASAMIPVDGLVTLFESLALHLRHRYYMHFITKDPKSVSPPTPDDIIKKEIKSIQAALLSTTSNAPPSKPTVYHFYAVMLKAISGSNTFAYQYLVTQVNNAFKEYQDLKKLTNSSTWVLIKSKHPLDVLVPESIQSQWEDSLVDQMLNNLSKQMSIDPNISLLEHLKMHVKQTATHLISLHDLILKALNHYDNQKRKPSTEVSIKTNFFDQQTGKLTIDPGSVSTILTVHNLIQKAGHVPHIGLSRIAHLLLASLALMICMLTMIRFWLEERRERDSITHAARALSRWKPVPASLSSSASIEWGSGSSGMSSTNITTPPTRTHVDIKADNGLDSRN